MLIKLNKEICRLNNGRGRKKEEKAVKQNMFLKQGNMSPKRRRRKIEEGGKVSETECVCETRK